MPRKMELSLATIRDWLGDTQIKKGRPYASGTAVSGTVRMGNTLKASVQGSRDRPYRVQLTLRDGEIASGDCSCPVGDGGRCKHAAAVLLTYLEKPERFSEVDDLDANLQARDKAELIALIKQFIRRAPELESLLAAPLPGFRKSAIPVTPDVYRRQALDAIREMNPDDEWAGSEISDGLDDILSHGREFESAGDTVSAAAVYQGVASAMTGEEIDYLDTYGSDDTTGKLAAGLLRCLLQLPTGSAKREAVLRSLSDLLQMCGDLGSDPDDGRDLLPRFLDAITPDERRTLSRGVKQAGKTDTKESYRGSYRARLQADLLLAIDSDVMDDEHYLDHCRRFGLREDLLTRLVELGRTDEAFHEVAGISADHEFLRSVEILAQQGLGDPVEQLVRKRPKIEKNAALLQWLKSRAEARKDADEVVRLGEILLDFWPVLDQYQDVKKWAGTRWPAHQEKLIARFEKERSYGLLTDIYLYEERFDDAIRVMRLDRSGGRELKVAQAVEKARPEVAIEIYRKKVERTVEHRHREAYQEAVKYLKKVGDLMTRSGQAAEFRTYVTGLAEKYRILRAFQEELRKAKLLAEVPPSSVILKMTKRKTR